MSGSEIKLRPIVVPERRFATFDNPDTGDREWYRNGQIIAKVDNRLIEMARKHPGPNNPFSEDALLKWSPGKIIGDYSAISMD